MDALLDYLDDIEEVLVKSKSIPLTGRVSVDKERILDIINKIRFNLPEDIRLAQRIVDDHDKIINDAKHMANSLLDEAKREVKSMKEPCEYCSENR